MSKTKKLRSDEDILGIYGPRQPRHKHCPRPAPGSWEELEWFLQEWANSSGGLGNRNHELPTLREWCERAMVYLGRQIEPHIEKLHIRRVEDSEPSNVLPEETIDGAHVSWADGEKIYWYEFFWQMLDGEIVHWYDDEGRQPNLYVFYCGKGMLFDGFWEDSIYCYLKDELSPEIREKTLDVLDAIAELSRIRDYVRADDTIQTRVACFGELFIPLDSAVAAKRAMHGIARIFSLATRFRERSLVRQFEPAVGTRKGQEKSLEEHNKSKRDTAKARAIANHKLALEMIRKAEKELQGQEHGKLDVLKLAASYIKKNPKDPNSKSISVRTLYEYRKPISAEATL